MKDSYIIVFSSPNVSLHLYKILKDKRYPVEMIPTPCRLSSDCARALQIKPNFIEEVIKIIKFNNINIKNIYKKNFNTNTGRFSYTPISV